ncbi:hypothetical protein ABD440_24605 [Chromobacterium piscinae]
MRINKDIFHVLERLCLASMAIFLVMAIALNSMLYQGSLSDVVSIICYVVLTLGVAYIIALKFKREKKQVEFGVLSFLSILPISMFFDMTLWGQFIHVSKFSLISVLILFFSIAVNAWWGYRMARGFKQIFYTPDLRNQIYKETDDFFLFKRGSQELPMKRVGISLGVSVSALVKIMPVYIILIFLLYFKNELSLLQSILSIMSLPLVMTFNGVLVFCFCIYLYYPSILKRNEKKEVVYQF